MLPMFISSLSDVIVISPFPTVNVVEPSLHGEDRGLRGRADEALKAGNHIWIFELKVDGSADEALEQIETKDYGKRYAYLMKPGMALHKVGISFSSAERRIAEWKSL